MESLPNRVGKRVIFRTVSAFLVLALAGQIPASPLLAREPDRISAEQAGFSPERLASIDRYYAAKVARGEMAGIVLLIARRGSIVHFESIGYADTHKQKPLRKDDIFRLYSMTKPIAATALMMLYEEGKFQLDDPVSKYIPEFKGIRVLRSPTSPIIDTVPAEREPTIHDLLRFTDGFVHGLRGAQSPLDMAYQQAGLFDLDVSLEEMMRRLAKLPLAYQPGSTTGYGVAPDIQARLVEIFSGMSFKDFLQARIFDPLAMADTGFSVDAGKSDRLVAVHWSRDGKILPMGQDTGYPKPESLLLLSWSVESYIRPNLHTGGSFGLVGTAEDYWRFAQMMANGGVFKGKRLLGTNTVKYMTKDHRSFLFPEGAPEHRFGWGWGLGFAVMNNSARAGMMSSDGTYFWHGAAGTTFWIDPEKELVVVALTQHMGSDKSDLMALAPEIRTLVYSAMTD